MSLKFSIVTPSLNQGKFITDCIESVLNQEYANFEHIVIDGGSKDQTLQILNNFKHLTWISEKDNGCAEAINKGFKIASGDILTWLNSDDYFEPNIFNSINNIFQTLSETEMVSGSITIVDENKNIIFKDKTQYLTKEILVHKNADLVRQPSTFFRRGLLERVGPLDEKLKLTFDYDLFIKMLSLTKPFYIEDNFAYQRH